MWKATIKGLMAHKVRLALTALAVILGVSFMAGTYVLTDTMNGAFTDLMREGTAQLDVFVRSTTPFVGEDVSSMTARKPVPASLLQAVRGVEGVRQADGEVTGYAQLVDKQGKAIAPFGPPTLGVSWPEPSLSALVVRQGRRPERAGEVAVDAVTAKKYGFHVGDSVTVLLQGPSEKFTIVGIAGYGKADNLAGATIAVFDTKTAQRVLGKVGQFDLIDVQAKEGVSPASLRARIAAMLPAGVEAATSQTVADEQSKALESALSFFRTGMLVFAGVALFVGAFIIFNTFGILVTQRSRELALLRALGASGAQVMRSVLAESAIVGLFASVLGLGLGIGVAAGLRALLSAFGMSLPSSGLQVLPRTMIVSIVVGVVVTLSASISPARRAARVPPMAALRDVSIESAGSSRRRTVAGAVVTVVGVAVLFVGLFGGGDIKLVGGGVAAVFLGVAALAPLVARPLGRVIGAPVARLRGLPGKLGRENAMRNPKRTASTSSALMIGLALVGTFLILGASLKASVLKAIDETFRADYMLTTNNQMSGFSPTLAQRLRDRAELGVVSETRAGSWRRQGTGGTRFLTAVDPASIEKVLKMDVRHGSAAALGTDGVLLDRRTAEQEKLKAGDQLVMEFAATGAVPMRVAGIIYDENGLLGGYTISLAAYERNFTEQLDRMVLVKAAPAFSIADARRVLEVEAKSYPSVKLQDQAATRAEQEKMINQMLGLISALLGLAVIIALLGIVNTLALSVFERSRELGLLRAVGMSRRQVREMVRWESVIIALLGGVLGLAVGVFFGWSLVAALHSEGISEFSVPVGQLVVFLFVSGLCGVLAAVFPARRAANMDILRAVTVE